MPDVSVLLAGYYGFDNAGDEALLRVVVAELRRALPDVALTVVSQQPERHAAALAVDAVHWQDVDGLLRAAKASSAIVVGGGGLFHDYFQPDLAHVLTRRHSGLSFTASWPLLAALVDRPLVLWGVGVGPLRSEEGREVTRACFEQAAYASVRDRCSAELLEDLGVAPGHVQVAADPALLLPLPDGTAARAALAGTDRPLVGVAVRPWDVGAGMEEWTREVARGLDAFLDEHGGSAVFVPMQRGQDALTDDRAAGEAVRGSMRHAARTTALSADLPLEERAGLLAACDVVLAMRLHGMVFASVGRVPAVPLAYDGKVRAFAAQVGAGDRLIELADVSAETVSTRLASACKSDAAELEDAARRVVLAARQDADRVVALLRDGTARARPVRPRMQSLVRTTALAHAADLDARERRGAELEAALSAAQADAQSLRRELDELSAASGRTERQLHREVRWRQEQLDLIHSSRSWRAVALVWSIRRGASGAFTRRRSSSHPKLSTIVLRVANSARPVIPYLPARVKGVLRRVLTDVAQGQLRPTVPRATRSSAGGAGRVEDDHHLTPVLAPDHATARTAHLPLVSVVLPVYNQADMLGAAVDSVLQQSYPNVELILLDDGSTDDIAPVLGRAARCSGVTILRQPNQKLPRALTGAFAHASGELLTWTSADNLLEPDAIAELVDGLLARPDAALVYADVRVIDERGEPLRDRSYRPQNVDPDRPEIIRLPHSTEALGYEADNYINACFLYRREASEVLEHHYADDLRGVEDYDFWLRMQRVGRLRHIGNSEPLYSYRVHRRSMSEELLTRERQAHLERLKVLLDYEGRRREAVAEPWVLAVDEGSPQELAEQAGLAARPTSARVIRSTTGWSHDQPRRLRLVPADQDCTDEVWLALSDSAWHVRWVSRRTGEPRSVVLPFARVTPLARKARDHVRNLWMFPQAGDRPIVGCHRRAIDDDVPVISALAAAHPDVFFVLADAETATAGPPAPATENLAFVGPQPYGASYGMYACFDLLLAPPSEDPGPPLDDLALAYAIGRPLLVPDDADVIVAPYQFRYSTSEGCFLPSPLPSPSLDADLLDAYLEQWTPSGALRSALRHAAGVVQEWTEPRPAFGVTPPAPVPPSIVSTVEVTERCRGALVVPELDSGGLEEVVAMLAVRLPHHDIDMSVVCTRAGGRTADRLVRAGVEVVVAGGDPAILADHLRRRRSRFVNSHLADLDMLRAARDLGVPVLETVHNTYAWYGEADWKAERARSRFFTNLTAVSDLVREYYRTRNRELGAVSIQVVPNAYDPRRLQLPDRATARRELGIDERDVVFLSLGRYDGQKNFLGTIDAFDAVARDHPEARLVIAGSISDPIYTAAVERAAGRVAAANQVTLLDFDPDAGRLLAAADAFVLNSFFEGWSLAATEALFAGLPLLHSRCGSGPELVGSNGERGILVGNPAGDPLALDRPQLDRWVQRLPQTNRGELIDALERLLVDRTEWQRRRPSIRAYAARVFGPDQMSAAYAQLITRMLRGHASRQAVGVEVDRARPGVPAR